jgi:hypothetical protein
MSLFRLTAAWGTIPQIATITSATISPDSGSVPFLPGRLLASAYGANHRHSHHRTFRRYSITSSARASSIGGTVRPSALAVC